MSRASLVAVFVKLSRAFKEEQGVAGDIRKGKENAREREREGEEKKERKSEEERGRERKYE